MRKAFFGYFSTVINLLVIFALMGCHDLTIMERPYQRLLISNFSAPLRTSLPPYNGLPTSLTLRISGTISKPVILTVDQLGDSQGRYMIRRDTLIAGTYTDKRLTGDHYSSQSVELTVTGTDSTAGNLIIEWYRQ